MRLAVVLSALIALYLVPAGTALAQLNPGTVEMETDFALNHSRYAFTGDAYGSFTSVDLDLSAGYFFTELFEAGGAVLVRHQTFDPEFGGSSSATSLGLEGLLTFNLPAQGRMVPFVRAGAGFLTYSGDGYSDAKTTVIAPDLSAGVRFLVGGSASLNLAARYAHETASLGVEDLAANNFGLTLGVSFFPRH